MRGDPERLGQLLLTAPGGEKVPLASVADIRTIQGPEAINHEGGQRRLVVQTNVRGRDVGSFVAEAQQKMAAAVKLPAGLLRRVGRAVREPGSGPRGGS